MRKARCPWVGLAERAPPVPAQDEHVEQGDALRVALFRGIPQGSGLAWSRNRGPARSAHNQDGRVRAGARKSREDPVAQPGCGLLGAAGRRVDTAKSLPTVEYQYGQQRTIQLAIDEAAERRHRLIGTGDTALAKTVRRKGETHEPPIEPRQETAGILGGCD